MKCSFWDVYAETKDCLVVIYHDLKNSFIEKIPEFNARVTYIAGRSRTICPIISGLLGLHHFAIYVSE
jgi:hypothetical protein